MAKKGINMFEYKLPFNDIVMREMGFDIDESDYLYDIDMGTTLQIKGKFIKYSEYEYPTVRSNEIDLNLIENPRLMEILFTLFISKYSERNGLEASVLSQCPIKGSIGKGQAIIAFNDRKNNMISYLSDPFDNESVRIFNLVCKINHTTHLYDFNHFDVLRE